MTREFALYQLMSSKAEHRLRAARTLAREGTADDIDKISVTLANETNRWVKSALRSALLAIEGGVSPVKLDVGSDSEDDQLIEEIRSEAVQETTHRLIHEIRPVLGRLRLHLKNEVPKHLNSKSWSECEDLARLLAAMDQLGMAAASPTYAEFDLGETIEAITATEAFGKKAKLELAGPRPLIVESSEGLIRLILCNGIRNAIEASEEVESTLPVVVNWGITDRDFWISVLDSGKGLPANLSAAFEIGTTSKKGHFGMGLALARQAIQSLSGKISLTPRKEGGVQFEVICPTLL